MRIDEIQRSDDMIWIAKATGNSFYVDFENLKRRHMLLTGNYDTDTRRSIIMTKIEALEEMTVEIRQMQIFVRILRRIRKQ